ncbi:hypothetical protein MCUN1_000566 [Malassezia cuniculi]|uniref:RAD50-interacting protein 1 n=1 Tax=Malassezia cuniculi TaxID=948313 RepID=A0AAF0J9X4_9BASI|nr:hypothetical protein MCUN1_000566 [Malassezia cuniculi]
MATSLGHAPGELEAKPSLMHQYLQPPPYETVHALATIDTDLRLLPTVRSGATDLDEALTHIRGRGEKALTELHEAENALRTAIVDANDGFVPEDADIAEVIDIYGASLRPPHRASRAPVDAGVVELRIAKHCTELLARAEKATEGTQTDIDSALQALSRLAAVADDAGQHALIGDSMWQKTQAILSTKRDDYYSALVTRYSDALRTALSGAAWPPPELQNPEHRAGSSGTFTLLTDDIKSAWSDLCSLQFAAASLGLTSPPSAVHHVTPLAEQVAVKAAPGSADYAPLFAVSILIEPILLRFRFHFDSDRSTNRLDKPEWFLSNILALIQLNNYLFQAAPDMWSEGGDVYELTRFRAGRPRRHCNVDAPAELLHALLTPLRLKLSASMELLSSQPALLAHTIFQCLAFDNDLRSAYGPAADAIRLADDMLSNDSLFQRWLDGEREFATRRFEDVVEAPGAWSLVQAETLTEEGEAEHDDIDTGGKVTTKAAATLITILVSVTERYQPLESLEQRSAFIIRVQHPLLFEFYDRLARHLDAYENMSSAFSRALPGEITSLSSGSGADAVRGVNGIRRVVKAYISASYVHQQLVEWSELSFFLHMADEIHALPRGAPLRRLMYPSKDTDIDSSNLVAILHKGLQKGASAVRPRGRSNSPAAASRELELDEPISVWERFISRYADICARCKRGIERLVVSEVLDLLKPYFFRPWDSTAEPDNAENDDEPKTPITHDSPCKELVPALARLSSLLTELVQTMPPTLLLPIYRHISASLSSAIVDRVMLPDARVPQKFAPDQAKQFSVDVHNGWLHVVRELERHPRIVARRKKNEPTGLGRRPEAQWKTLVEAASSIAV